MNKRFLDYWKQAVLLAGPKFFNITPQAVTKTNDINKLLPNYDKISVSVNIISPRDLQFLIAVCSFHNDQKTINLFGHVHSFDDLFKVLDARRVAVLIGLTLTFRGW